MCGRFVKKSSKEELRKRFGFNDPNPGVLLEPSYNIAPSQEQPILIVSEDRRILTMMKWGLVPYWSKDPKIGFKMINARSEGIEQKPSFKTPLKRKRCIIMADGFYEWQKSDKKTKTPFYFRLKSGEPFAMAGIWDLWKNGDQTLKTFTIITTTPNELMEPVHNRMPVILNERDETRWLDTEITNPELVLPLLKPYPSDEMESYKVSSIVNSPKNDIRDCIAAID
ncbi:MAG: SOS response-associated peptidase [Thermodesulfobacteriota bacterium]